MLQQQAISYQTILEQDLNMNERVKFPEALVKKFKHEGQQYFNHIPVNAEVVSVNVAELPSGGFVWNIRIFGDWINGEEQIIYDSLYFSVKGEEVAFRKLWGMGFRDIVDTDDLVGLQLEMAVTKEKGRWVPEYSAPWNGYCDVIN